MNYNSNIINNISLISIINEIEKIVDDTDIIFDKELKNIFNLEYDKINNNEKALYSFIYYEDNDKYNNKLIYEKLYYTINWSKKYNFELKDDLNIFVLIMI